MAKPKRSVAEITKLAKPRTETVTLYLAGDGASRIQQLEQHLADLADWKPGSMADADPRRAIAEQIRELQEEVRDSAAEFTFQALGAVAWSELLLRHPGRSSAEAYNPETLLPELVVEACVDPVMTPAEYDGLAEVINAGQRDQLEAAAWRANMEATAVPFSLASYAIGASPTADT